VLPLSLFSVQQLSHEVLASALAFGAEHVVVLASPAHSEELPALESQLQLVRTLLAGLGHRAERLHLCTERDPDAVEALLYQLQPLDGSLAPAEIFTALGSKRDVARTALAKLKERAPAPQELIALPAGAPYGRIHIDTSGCTLCLACVGACPTNALSDNPDRPQVALTEAACVQCGICVATCPENVITLEPRYNFAPAALSPVVLNTEEPFHCVACGKPFGTKASIERVLARLKGRHAMFQTEAQLRVIQMCDNCRVIALAEQGNDPFKGPARPRVRTTEDYLTGQSEGRDTSAIEPGKKPEDFLS
jgi:ferredoxin